MISLRKRELYFWAVLLTTVYLFIEAASWACLRMLQWKGVREFQEFQQNEDEKALQAWANDPQSFFIFSPTLGWTNRPGAVRSSGREAINSQGIRSDRTFSPIPASGVLRIVTFGDSFTHGTEVALADTWQEQLMTKHPNWELLNFGVPVYGPDQALLRYREIGSEFHPHIVLIGFMAENIKRTVNVYRPFYVQRSDRPPKPRFILVDGHISLVPNPFQTLSDFDKLVQDEDRTVRDLGRYDYFYHTNFLPRTNIDFLPSVKLAKRIIIEIRRRVIYEPILINNVYNSRSEAFIITREILVRFYREALARGELPIIVLFPDRHTHGQYQKGHPISYGPLRDYFQSNRIRYIDTLLKLGPESASTIFAFIHYSPRGNSLVSEAIEQYLEKERLQDLSNFQRIMESERANFILHPSGRR